MKKIKKKKIKQIKNNTYIKFHSLRKINKNKKNILKFLK